MLFVYNFIFCILIQCFANIFSRFVCCLFTQLTAAFALQNTFEFNIIPLIYFCFCCLWFTYKKLRSMSWSFTNMVSSRNVKISGLTCQSSIHLGLSFTQSIRHGSNFVQLHVISQFSPHCLLKCLSFLHFAFFTLTKINWLQVCEYFVDISMLFHCSECMFYVSTMLFYLVWHCSIFWSQVV